jgi:hypothetical protein
VKPGQAAIEDLLTDETQIKRLVLAFRTVDGVNKEVEVAPGQGDYDGFLYAQSEVEMIELIHRDLDGNEKKMEVDPRDGEYLKCLGTSQQVVVFDQDIDEEMRRSKMKLEHIEYGGEVDISGLTPENGEVSALDETYRWKDSSQDMHFRASNAINMSFDGSNSTFPIILTNEDGQGKTEEVGNPDDSISANVFTEAREIGRSDTKRTTSDLVDLKQGEELKMDSMNASRTEQDIFKKLRESIGREISFNT